MIKVAEWQQTYYASDSGIHSGATTVRDDESSTDYSGRKKYSSGSTAIAMTVSAANATGEGEPASGTLETPTGEKVIVFMIIITKPLRLIPMTIWAVYIMGQLMVIPTHIPTAGSSNITFRLSTVFHSCKHFRNCFCEMFLSSGLQGHIFVLETSCAIKL